jgi:cytochrome c-type biogenesis protein CcmH/NrfG
LRGEGRGPLLSLERATQAASHATRVSRAGLRHAVLRKPDYLEAGYSLGLALERLGRTGEAARTYESLLRWYPREELLRERLASFRGKPPDRAKSFR